LEKGLDSKKNKYKRSQKKGKFTNVFVWRRYWRFTGRFVLLRRIFAGRRRLARS